MNPAKFKFLFILCVFALQARSDEKGSRPEDAVQKTAAPLAPTNNPAEAPATEVQGRILQYGIATSGSGTSVNAPNDPTGKHLILKPGTIHLETATNRIPARIGVAFGCFCEISGLVPTNADVLTAVWTYPPMLKPDGAFSTGFAFTHELRIARDGRAIGWVGYHFEYPYELVPGEWRLELKYKAKSIATQEFTVYKPPPKRSPL
jgi:hypothetical protein